MYLSTHKTLRGAFMTNMYKCLLGVAASGFLVQSALAAKPIQHDAEHYVLLHQYKEQWAKEDKEIDSKLAEIREKNGGKKRRDN